MQRIGLWVVAAALTGCALQGTSPDAVSETTVAQRAAQEQACAAAVASHVGKSVDAVSAAWTGLNPSGTATVTVSDVDAGAATGERVHACEVDANARVLAILHPGT